MALFFSMHFNHTALFVQNFQQNKNSDQRRHRSDKNKFVFMLQLYYIQKNTKVNLQCIFEKLHPCQSKSAVEDTNIPYNILFYHILDKVAKHPYYHLTQLFDHMQSTCIFPFQVFVLFYTYITPPSRTICYYWLIRGGSTMPRNPCSVRSFVWLHRNNFFLLYSTST